MGKLKSSMKSLQEAIASLRPTAPAICVQEAKTRSFRAGEENPSSSFITPSSSFSSSSSSHQRRRKLTPMEDYSSASSSSSSLPLSGSELSCKRFFFSPSKTKSIMEEVDGVFSDPCSGEAAAGGFYDAVAVESDDPYGDFKRSMEEMVAAHGPVRDWRRLQELLVCYLMLNEKKIHEIIVLAFADLLLQFTEEDPSFPFSLCFQ
ncbi:hypothetical protein AXF42_Ash008500 [Apostasia shenzhenica]|uniref:Transcription repressor n=1 Tax=Apostasia shenzhenica TaxID=1088818 RepID=A0A2I0AY20_9ASPA|nr:hypothetical protein AXF42_Ash008500 [Apostasia shenzhenica]